MKTELTEIAFVLDRSGSMESCREQAIAGFNQFLRDQQSAPGTARLSLVLFDDQYEVPVSGVPLPEVTELTTRTFVPRGSTALLDAIGLTIDETGARLAALPECDRPGQVIVAILTDGMENASKKFTWHDISARIAHQRDTYNWQFLFLGANADAIATASALNIDRSMSSHYTADGIGHNAVMRSTSRKVTALRAKAANPGSINPDHLKDFATPLGLMVQEEDDKERKK